tara:strand:+ start:4401 stop:5126 length:726 start_codon:yes stop_codon:yes gene_type:complete
MRPVCYRLRRSLKTTRSTLAVGVLLLSLAPMIEAGQVLLPGAGATLNVTVSSFKERKFKTIIAQQYDYSCGSAALASLLTYHYRDAINEAQVFESMYVNGDQAAIAREGFSLLDMKRYLERRGYSANGYRISLDKLAGNEVPAIVLINHDGYKHFVIVKGVTKQAILLGDPSRGLHTVARETFEDMWNGIVFVILDKRDIAQRHFNQNTEWSLVPIAPVAQAMPRESLAAFNLGRPLSNDF